MPIDPYSPCPGGTGKKIKFCCSELVGDLEQLDRLTEGQQYAAALAEVDKLTQRHPGRACLMAHRTRLQLATKQFPAAAAGSAAFLETCPDNPVALGLAAVTEAIAGRMQESRALFDQARDHANTQARDTDGMEVPQDLVRTAQTLVQAAAQTGHPGCAQGIVEWMIDASVGTEEERQLLASIVGSGGVPPALRTKVSFEPAPADSPHRFEFEAALKAAAEWRLSKALATFRSLKPVAGESPELFTNMAILCEMLGRPYEASEAWLTVAKLRAGTPDDAVEATGRAIAMETEADPFRGGRRRRPPAFGRHAAPRRPLRYLDIRPFGLGIAGCGASTLGVASVCSGTGRGCDISRAARKRTARSPARVADDLWPADRP